MIQENSRYCDRISNKLNDSRVFPKAYWSILKVFLKSKKNSDYSTFIL